MKKNSEVTETGTAFKKKLDTPLPYTIEWESYESKEEMIAAKDEMTLEEQFDKRNADRKSAARTAALNAALAAAGYVKPTAENDAQLRLRDMVKTILTSKNDDGSPMYTRDQAIAAAEGIVRVKWED